MLSVMRLPRVLILAIAAIASSACFYPSRADAQVVSRPGFEVESKPWHEGTIWRMTNRSQVLLGWISAGFGVSPPEGILLSAQTFDRVGNFDEDVQLSIRGLDATGASLSVTRTKYSVVGQQAYRDGLARNYDKGMDKFELPTIALLNAMMAETPKPTEVTFRVPPLPARINLDLSPLLGSIQIRLTSSEGLVRASLVDNP